MEKSQQIINAITNIKVPGAITMAYWSILKTSDGIYFVQTGWALGMGIGLGAALTAVSLAGDIIETHKAKNFQNNQLDEIINKSEQTLFFSRDKYNLIETKPGWIFGGSVKFPSGKEKSWKEKGYIKLKLSRKNFDLFLQMLQS